MDVLWGLGGMVVILAIAVLFSADRRRISVRTVGLALAIQVIFGVLVLYVPAGKAVLGAMTEAVQAVINSSRAGIDFLFGPILPEEGSVFAFQVLPVIVFFAALTAVLYHLGILQWVVKIIGGGLAKLLGTTRPESMNAAANIFVGQTEAPLVIRPYISGMTRSELFAVMAGGLTTVAGSVLVGYSLLGANLDYLIAASFMAAPAALMMAKILVPAGALEDAGPTTEPARSVERGAADAEDRGGPSVVPACRARTVGSARRGEAETASAGREGVVGAAAAVRRGRGSRLPPRECRVGSSAAVLEADPTRSCAGRGSRDGRRGCGSGSWTAVFGPDTQPRPTPWPAPFRMGPDAGGSAPTADGGPVVSAVLDGLRGSAARSPTEQPPARCPSAACVPALPVPERATAGRLCGQRHGLRGGAGWPGRCRGRGRPCKVAAAKDRRSPVSQTGPSPLTRSLRR
ncbi:Na+ dependent nucleoside transporter N-terminal domain-containing protein [Georgenia sp. SUBG003]|uniref:Na+ dependent nucleoside transporter N-terminal domain-containing protein n=1 Tax=Georgenia sp. SUBG003 TaxID=1497974 RepID=UPI003AB1DA83